MAKVRVLFDAVSWEVQEGDTLRHYRGRYGEVVDIPDEELERLSGMGAVVPEDDARERVLEEIDRGGRGGANFVSDDQLREFTGAELIAYVNQYPDEARRVFNLERSGRGDQAVLAATGYELDGDTDDGDPAVYPRAGVDRTADPRDGLRPEVVEAVGEEAKKGARKPRNVGRQGNAHPDAE